METDEFLAYLSNVKRYSQHTITAYAEDLCQFIEFCEKVENVSEWTEVTPLVVRHFEMELMAGRLNRRKRQGQGRPKALNARSVQRKLCALRSLFRYLIHEGVVEHSPMEGVAPLKFAKNCRFLFRTTAWILCLIRRSGSRTSRDIGIICFC